MAQNREERSPSHSRLERLRAARLWLSLGITLGLMLTFLASLAASVLGVPEPLRKVAEWAFIISAVAMALAMVIEIVRTIRTNPERRRRLLLVWHTVGGRVLFGGSLAVAIGLLTAYADLLVGEWIGNFSDNLAVLAIAVAIIGMVAVFVGLITVFIEDAVRESRWPDGWR